MPYGVIVLSFNGYPSAYEEGIFVEAAVVVVAATTRKELTERGRVPWIQRTLNNK